MNGIILASGFSERMGENKLLMKFKDNTIIEQVIDIVKSSNLNKVILIARDDRIINIGKEKRINSIKNYYAIIGQSSSIKIGINNSNLEENYMFFCGDQPFIDKESINRLIDISNKNKDNIIIPRIEKDFGSPVIFPKEFKEELLDLKGDIGGKYIINNYLDKVLYVEIDNKLFLKDIDNKEDYNKYIKMIK